MVAETKIENEVCKYAELHGWLQYKFSSPGNSGVPDRIFMRKGEVFFIEFKATDKEPRKLQHKIMDDIRGEWLKCYVVDDIEYGKQIIDVQR